MMFSLQAKAISALLAIILIAAGAWKLRHDGYKAGAADVRQEYAALATQAALAAIKTQERLQDAVQKVGDRHEKTKRAIAATADAAGFELDGLRNELAARDRAADQAPSATSGADAAGAERQLLGACAQTLLGLAKDADRVEAKLTGLQDYVTSVCQAPP
jgi:hypothetical protein